MLIFTVLCFAIPVQVGKFLAMLLPTSLKQDCYIFRNSC